MVPHQTPENKKYGKSNISTKGEYYYDIDYTDTGVENDIENFINNASIGLGPRVPCFVISPWSTGGNINSQVFDHTSTLMFLEKLTGVKEPNISEWRREICGDLMSCFDFQTKYQTSYEYEFRDAQDDGRNQRFKKRKGFIILILDIYVEKEVLIQNQDNTQNQI